MIINNERRNISCFEQNSTSIYRLVKWNHVYVMENNKYNTFTIKIVVRFSLLFINERKSICQKFKQMNIKSVNVCRSKHTINWTIWLKRIMNDKHFYLFFKCFNINIIDMAISLETKSLKHWKMKECFLFGFLYFIVFQKSKLQVKI